MTTLSAPRVPGRARAVRRLVVAGLSALGAAAVAAPAAAQEATPMRYPPSSVRYKLIGGGVAVTGAAYGMSFLAATEWPDSPGAGQLKIPVVGPWMALANNGCPASDPSCGFSKYLRGVLFIIDGLMQGGGLGIAGEGIFMTTEAEAPKRKRPDQARVVVRPVPFVTARTTGLAVVGSF